jgi:hypothetical protein
MEELGAVMEMAVRVAGVTVREKLLEVTPLSEAVMLVEPPARAVARPVEETEATAALEECHVTWEVMLAEELSL